MRKLTNQGILNLYNDSIKHRYKKKGRYLYRRAYPGETVLTIVSGKLETIMTAGDNQVILRNLLIGSSAETYMIDYNLFLKIYDEPNKSKHYVIDGILWGEAFAKGEIDAFEYKGEDITFIAPWGEEMMCVEGDFIARPVLGNTNDIYRIERAAFDQTYSLNE